MASLEHTAISRPKPADFIPGYRLEKLVGKGGMGEVHQATQLSLGRTVAVKLLNQELAKDDQFVARFEKEGAALATLRHPNIVSIVDKGKTDSTYYLVMEFVDGPSLREVMRSPLLDAAQSLRMMLQICRAIEYAHGRGVIHRDLKPENILFDEQAGGIAKVTDFGLAGFDERAAVRPLENLTQTNVAMGTASYMAPEQQVDARSADHRADIYSLGILLYELLTGDLPMGKFDPPSVKKPALDKRLDDIVSRCLKPNPKERYQNLNEMLQQLEPLVPMTSMLGTVQMSPMRRALRKAREAAQTLGRMVEIAVVLAAVAIVGAAFLRSAVKDKRVPAGQELNTEFNSRWPLTTAGRIDHQEQVVTLGEGPDVVSIVGTGRKPDLRGGEVAFGAPFDQPAGRALIDVHVEGSTLSLSTTAAAQPTPKSQLEPLKEVFRGARPDARAALMLLGEPGRYVALVVSGAGEAPTLEWALGSEHRGTMSAAVALPAKATRLELKLNAATGELSAFVGEGADQRPLADPLSLGPKWEQLFGERPRGALGCLEGSCVFQKTRLAGTPPEPPAVPLADAAPPPSSPHSPAPAPVALKPKPVTLSQAVVTKRPVVPRPPPPPPPKKTVSKKR